MALLLASLRIERREIRWDRSRSFLDRQFLQVGMVRVHTLCILSPQTPKDRGANGRFALTIGCARLTRNGKKKTFVEWWDSNEKVLVSFLRDLLLKQIRINISWCDGDCIQIHIDCCVALGIIALHITMNTVRPFSFFISFVQKEEEKVECDLQDSFIWKNAKKIYLEKVDIDHNSHGGASPMSDLNCNFEIPYLHFTKSLASPHWW